VFSCTGDIAGYLEDDVLRLKYYAKVYLHNGKPDVPAFCNDHSILSADDGFDKKLKSSSLSRIMKTTRFTLIAGGFQLNLITCCLTRII
jgi:hypothetical protein